MALRLNGVRRGASDHCGKGFSTVVSGFASPQGARRSPSQSPSPTMEEVVPVVPTRPSLIGGRPRTPQGGGGWQSSDEDEEIGDMELQRRRVKSVRAEMSGQSATATATASAIEVFAAAKLELASLTPRTGKSAKHLGHVPVPPKDGMYPFRHIRVSQRVYIQDYEFTNVSVTMHVGETIEFSLADDVPDHAEHQLESRSLETSLCFESQLLTNHETSIYRFSPSVTGEFTVRCKIQDDMCPCVVTVIPGSTPSQQGGLGSSSSPIDIGRAVSNFDPAARSPLRHLCPSRPSRRHDSASALQHSLHPPLPTTSAMVGLGGGIMSYVGGGAGYTSDSSFYDSDDVPSSSGENELPPSGPLVQPRRQSTSPPPAPSPTLIFEQGAAAVVTINQVCFSRTNLKVNQGSRVVFKCEAVSDTNEHKLIVCRVTFEHFHGYNENLSDEVNQVRPVAEGGWMLWVCDSFHEPGLYVVRDEIFSYLKCYVTVQPHSKTTTQQLEHHQEAGKEAKASYLCSSGVSHGGINQDVAALPDWSYDSNYSAEALDTWRAAQQRDSGLGAHNYDDDVDGEQGEEAASGVTNSGSSQAADKKSSTKSKKKQEKKRLRKQQAPLSDATLPLETVDSVGRIVPCLPQPSALERQAHVEALLSSPASHQRLLQSVADDCFELEDGDNDESAEEQGGSVLESVSAEADADSVRPPPSYDETETPPPPPYEVATSVSTIASNISVAAPVKSGKASKAKAKTKTKAIKQPPVSAVSVGPIPQPSSVSDFSAGHGNQWECPRCTYMNAEAAPACAMCDAQHGNGSTSAVVSVLLDLSHPPLLSGGSRDAEAEAEDNEGWTPVVGGLGGVGRDKDRDKRRKDQSKDKDSASPAADSVALLDIASIAQQGKTKSTRATPILEPAAKTKSTKTELKDKGSKEKSVPAKDKAVALSWAGVPMDAPVARSRVERADKAQTEVPPAAAPLADTTPAARPEPKAKRATPPASPEQPAAEAAAESPPAAGSKSPAVPARCKFFGTTNPCKYGTKCRFLHDDKAGVVLTPESLPDQSPAAVVQVEAALATATTVPALVTPQGKKRRDKGTKSTPSPVAAPGPLAATLSPITALAPTTTQDATAPQHEDETVAQKLELRPSESSAPEEVVYEQEAAQSEAVTATFSDTARAAEPASALSCDYPWPPVPGMEEAERRVREMESFLSQRFDKISHLIREASMDTLPGGTQVPIVVYDPSKHGPNRKKSAHVSAPSTQLTLPQSQSQPQAQAQAEAEAELIPPSSSKKRHKVPRNKKSGSPAKQVQGP